MLEKLSMTKNSFTIRHHNFLVEIDAHIFGNRKFILAQIQAGFWGDVQATAKKMAVKLLKETWNLPDLAKDKACVKELTAQIVNSLSEHLEHQEETTDLTVTHAISEVIPKCEPQLEDLAKLPSAAVMFSSMEACTRKDLWQKDTEGTAYLRHKAKTNLKNYIEHYISTPGDITLLPWDEAQQIIDKFGFTTAKLHLIFAAHAMTQQKPWESQFNLKVSDIIKEFGWDRNHKKSKTEKLREIATTAFALDCLLVKAVWIEGKNYKGQIIASAPVGRMWNVYVKPIGQYNLEGKIDNPDDVYLTVQPGLWTRDFLNKAGATSRQALYQFGYLAKQVLAIDPYHNELALRLAIHLTLDSRVRKNGKYRVEELLEIALPKPAISKARKDYRKAYDLKQCWDSALVLLGKLNWQIEFDSLTYPEELRPESLEKNPRGYLDNLLNAYICIKPPNPIPELLASKATSQIKPSPLKTQKLKLATSGSLTGDQVREVRKIKGWSQAKLAGFLGVSQKLISLIERGERPITTKLNKKICQLLEI